MLFAGETHLLSGRRVLLRSARTDEADMLIAYLKTVTGETPFLLSEPDEVNFTTEGESAFIKAQNEAPHAMFMLAFVDGELAGTCSFSRRPGSRRVRHRAEIGIALFQRFTGFGLGRLMMERLLEKIREAGFAQAELTVIGGNDRARRLYESLGFRECGRIPDAHRYDDGSSREDILMTLQL